MKLRLWILLGLAAIALLASSTPVFRDSGAKSKDVPKVFDTVLQQRYPVWTPVYRECVDGADANHEVCWAEVRNGSRYLQVEVNIDLGPSTPVPSGATQHAAWTRAPIRIGYSAGSGVANSPAYDWHYLIQSNASPGATVLVIDGSSTGYAKGLFTFHCAGTPRTITCRNVAGDYVTYTPSAYR